jgi:hypothetical protein
MQQIRLSGGVVQEMTGPTSKPHALSGFIWSKGLDTTGIPEAQKYCLRNALCLLMRWGPDSDEWRSFQPGPPETDLKRLVQEKPGLGLRLHEEGDPDVDRDAEGVVTWRVTTPTGIIGHAEYALHIGDVADRALKEGAITAVLTRR